MKMRLIGDRENQNQAIETGNEVRDFSTLPVSLLLEIFLRLGTAALIYCKSVCKSWHKILSESSFSDYYEKYSGTNHFLLPVDLTHAYPDSEPLYLLEFDKNGDCDLRLIRVKLPVLVNRWSLSSKFLFDSCNGSLILFNKFVYISNPITGGCIELPKYANSLIEMNIEMNMVVYKIGFSPSENKFKVIRSAHFTLNNNAMNKLSILTVGVDDKWRALSLSLTRLWWFSNIWICLDGVFHWMVKDNNGTYWISTFDLAEERFGQIPHPPGVDLGSRVMLELYGNRLSLIDSSNELHIDIWTLSGTKTWSKYEIFYSWFPSEVNIVNIFLIGKLRNGALLFSDSTRIIHIDVKGKRCSKIQVILFPKINSRIIAHTPRFSSFWEDIMEGSESDAHVQPN